MNENQVTYLRWLAHRHPELYRQAAKSARAAVAAGETLGHYSDDDEQLGWINFVIQAVTTAASAVLQKKQVDKQVDLQKKALALSDVQANKDRQQAAQLQLLDVNTKRAQAKLPPVDINGIPIAATSLPVPAGLSPYVAAADRTVIPGVSNTITYSVGGVLLAAIGAKALKLI